MILTFREKSWLDPKAEYRMWDNLCRAFNEELVFVDEIPDIEDLIVLDESAEISLIDFEHPKKGIYLFGRTGLNNIQDNVPCIGVRIETPEPICQFGIVAAGMVLYDREMKNGNTNT